MDGRCKNCQWWKPRNISTESHECACPKIFFAVLRDLPNNAGPDDSVEMGYSEESDPEHVLGGDEAAVIDGSGYFAAFVPGPEFGCVHWAARE